MVDQDDFEIESADQIARSFEKIGTTVTRVMGGIVGVALLVGGIGICKAIGARSRDILLQILIEAVTLSLLGGWLGLAIGYLPGVAIAAMIPDFSPAVVPWWAVALSVLSSGGAPEFD